ncbi:hypothetical protein Trco_004500 [Trichoderma cornu-damae]|uniref:Uncharacterized protein n=1 Tax=Trichoderma cornu-damae TaxID=654480 RepID=A0A9P8QTD3_9HYPO|nr:hypothetical protein Trco_004500 [Trichoderma cornu-damae]
MSCPSTRAVYSNSNAKQPEAATDTNARAAAVSLCVVDDPTYSLDRFLGRRAQISADQHQRPPPGLGRTWAGTEAAAADVEAEAIARMAARLRSFDRQFGSNGEEGAPK